MSIKYIIIAIFLIILGFILLKKSIKQFIKSSNSSLGNVLYTISILSFSAGISLIITFLTY